MRDGTKTLEVHNLWTIYGLESDGSEAWQKLAAAGQRPQDWGDPERWTYHRFRYEWLTAPDEFNRRWINNAHCWTDLKLEPGEYPKLFSSLICQIMYPGSPPEICGRNFLREDDFWRESWGPMPPFYDGPEQIFMDQAKPTQAARPPGPAGPGEEGQE